MDLEKYIDELQTLVNVDCGTQTVAGVAQVAAVVRELWQQEEGWQTELVDLGSAVGPALLVTNKPQATQYDVLLVGHLDTVFPVGTVAERPMSRDENRLYGPGVSDMKSGLLNILWAMRTLPAEHLQRLSIAVAMNPDEETGSVHSSMWISELAKRSRCVLVCEAARADGSLVKARKGVGGYQLTFDGVAAHAGNEPEKGRSAITAFANSVLAINALTDMTRGTTLNVGVVQGGSAANVVAAKLHAELDVRFWENEEYERVHKSLQSLCQQGFLDGVTTTLTRVSHKPAMAASEETQRLMALVERAGKEEGISVTWQAVGGGSDANLTAALGIPTLDGLGPVGAGFHSADEWLDIASIEPRIRLLNRIITML
ncbi:MULTISPECIES: M20 family metallopeptidase [Citrobacter freundii complex]|uniref:M20 family metallopeptidase n=1 Tax=Citrobacter freundii complex TaxID=1344959 RepID=UPI00050661C2|nr:MULTISPECIES: M20 family metallopeptidase [Citrobacter]MCU6175486.1 M20 family metallopeptidase [Citrobacter cronae]UCA25781.1 M20 family metallopeptidase [Citrobacter werkmanii]GAL45435.1 peptidase M20 family protein [Citrobacter werkmanii NBRC 105721]HAT7569594.1 M20 family metallopeptidase [Citrobacter werkmanii]HCR3448142.1 M20 family metallopeptidase [Citrobacter werkmanii]